MTELLTRPPVVARARGAQQRPASLWWRGCMAAVWAVALGVAVLIVVSLIAWAADPRSTSSAASAVRAALDTWLLAHHVPIRIGAARLGLPPLGLTIALAVVVARASGALARAQAVRSWSRAAMVAGSVAIPYAVLGTFVASVATAPAARPEPVAVLLGTAVLGSLAAGYGAARVVARAGARRSVLPDWAGAVAAAAARAVLVLLVAGALLTSVALARHAGASWRTVHLLGGGVVGAVLIAMLDLLLLPNAVVLSVGYLAGPGFAIGAGSSVSPFGSHLGTVPALPLLSALPRTGGSAPVQLICLCALLTAAAWSGREVARRARGRSGWRMATVALGAGVFAAAVLTLLVAVAGGPAGPGRMATIGASPWRVGLALVGELAIPAAVAAVAFRALDGRRRS